MPFMSFREKRSAYTVIWSFQSNKLENTLSDVKMRCKDMACIHSYVSAILTLTVLIECSAMVVPILILCRHRPPLSPSPVSSPDPPPAFSKTRLLWPHLQVFAPITMSYVVPHLIQ